MNSFLVDTNCIIFYVTDRNPGQAEKVVSRRIKHLDYVSNNKRGGNYGDHCPGKYY